MNYKNVNSIFQKIIAKSGTQMVLKRGSMTVNTVRCVVTSSKGTAQSTTVDYEKLLLVSSTSSEPKVGDTVLVQGKDYTVIEVETVKPADLVLLYRLKVT